MNVLCKVIKAKKVWNFQETLSYLVWLEKNVKRAR